MKERKERLCSRKAIVRGSAVTLSLLLACQAFLLSPQATGARTADDDINAVAINATGAYSAPARVAAAPRYDYPAEAMAVSLTLDGRPVLDGACAEINGEIYVAVEKFMQQFGDFQSAYVAATEEVSFTGRNLHVSVKVGDPYITVNDRIIYTGSPVLSLRGWIFAPLRSMAKAVNATLTVRNGWYQASLRSGDTRRVATADDVYDSVDLYWLSRIISAEAKGEPLLGQIAVGNVVLNRMRSSEFPNTVKGVIFDSKYGIQFSPVANGRIYEEPTASAVMAAKICLEGYSISDKALYFFNPAIATSSWIQRSRRYITTIGGHAFYE